MLAVIALVISGLTFAWTVYWSLSQRKLATRPRLTVRSVWAFVPRGQDLGPRCIQTTATNTGLAAITVEGSSLLIRGRRGDRVSFLEWVHQDPTLPTRLEPGARWTGIVDADSVKSGLDRDLGARAHWSVRPIVGDSTGRAHKATPAAVGWRRLLPRRWMTLD